jgi:acetyl-CoA acetyltransferase
MTDIYIAGIAMTVFGRHPERSLHDMAGEALQSALRDAGCATSDLGVAFYSGMTNGPLQGQISIPGQVVFSKIGIESTTSKMPAPPGARVSISHCRACRRARPTSRSRWAPKR